MYYKECSKLLIVLPLFASFLILFSSAAYSYDDCPAIDCDCATLPSKDLKTVCYMKELEIKKECTNNDDQPMSYCTISGLKGYPLPLSIKLKEVEYERKDKINDLNKKVAALYWALRVDQGLAEDSIEQNKFARAQEILRIMDDNIESLFNLQRRVTESWIYNMQKGEALDAWRDYVKDSKIVADKLNELGNKLLDASPDKEANIKRAYGVLGLKALSLAGATYEHVGYGQSQIEKYAAAAQNLKTASQISKRVLGIKEQSKAETKHIIFYRNQTAARLHRASVYWILAKQREKAIKDLEESTQFFKSDDEFNQLLKKENEQKSKDKRFGFF